MDGLAGSGRTASGVKDFGDDEIGFERGKWIGFNSFEENRAKIGERIVVRRGDGSGGASGGLSFVREPEAYVIFGYGKDGARAAVDFHIFTVKRPIPGSLQNGLGFGIGEDNGGFVADMRIDVRLNSLSDRGNGERALRSEERRVGKE